MKLPSHRPVLRIFLSTLQTRQGWSEYFELSPEPPIHQTAPTNHCPYAYIMPPFEAHEKGAWLHGYFVLQKEHRRNSGACGIDPR